MCRECAIKHVSQAFVLVVESQLGYPYHVYMAIGHLAEAEREIYTDNYDAAVCIREARKELYESGVFNEDTYNEIISKLI